MWFPFDNKLVLENEGARAVYRGRHYVRIPEYRFSIPLILKGIERTLTMSTSGESNEVEGVAVFDVSRRRLQMIGAIYRQVGVLVYFVVPGSSGSEDLSHLTEQQRSWYWPCKLDYEANEFSGRLERWRLVICIPHEQILRIPEIVIMPHVNKLQFDVHLTGLYVPERKLSDQGSPRGDRAYLLPKSYWGKKTPRLLGYVSSLSIEQHVSCSA